MTPPPPWNFSENLSDLVAWPVPKVVLNRRGGLCVCMEGHKIFERNWLSKKWIHIKQIIHFFNNCVAKNEFMFVSLTKLSPPFFSTTFLHDSCVCGVKNSQYVINQPRGKRHNHFILNSQSNLYICWEFILYVHSIALIIFNEFSIEFCNEIIPY